VNFGERDRRTVRHYRADELKPGDVILEELNAFGTVGRTILREEGTVISASRIGPERDVLLQWQSLRGKRETAQVVPYVRVAVLR